jgi:hypothetical protein
MLLLLPSGDRLPIGSYHGRIVFSWDQPLTTAQARRLARRLRHITVLRVAGYDLALGRGRAHERAAAFCGSPGVRGGGPRADRPARGRVANAAWAGVEAAVQRRCRGMR